jgi:translation elongation factor EF-4
MAGAICVCSDLAALKTTVADRGILLPGDANTDQYRKQALQAISNILNDTERKRSLTIKAREWALQQTWANRAKEWAILFDSGEMKINSRMTARAPHK